MYIKRVKKFERNECMNHGGAAEYVVRDSTCLTCLDLALLVTNENFCGKSMRNGDIERGDMCCKCFMVY